VYRMYFCVSWGSGSPKCSLVQKATPVSFRISLRNSSRVWHPIISIVFVTLAKM
jgi:hypothetical protein